MQNKMIETPRAKIRENFGKSDRPTALPPHMFATFYSTPQPAGRAVGIQTHMCEMSRAQGATQSASVVAGSQKSLLDTGAVSTCRLGPAPSHGTRATLSSWEE